LDRDPPPIEASGAHAKADLQYSPHSPQEARDFTPLGAAYQKSANTHAFSAAPREGAREYSAMTVARLQHCARRRRRGRIAGSRQRFRQPHRGR